MHQQSTVTPTHTPLSAAHDMHRGSLALIWASEQGIISEQEYQEAELAYDKCQNKVCEVADI